MMRLATVLFSIAGVLGMGCGQLRDDLSRAQVRYEKAEYEQALVWLRSLEDDTAAMDFEQRARFYYLRGMTAHRLGQRADARHFLALARELAGGGDAVLGPTWTKAMERALEELAAPESTTNEG